MRPRGSDRGGEPLPEPLLQPHYPGGPAVALLDLKELTHLLPVERAVAFETAAVAEDPDPVLQSGDVHRHSPGGGPPAVT
ncbi:hypothetical protein F8E02_03895 [Methanoculleus sp. Wushi-C6]|uniref:Uncharacterized protein n=1 Tax=Methanoculleus caldifontis TaxID=2651577 RepID=A0ABU3WZD4_9EURY|nr:hypothetical protein [Methanoculleus sp. Wushi-C6]